MPLNLNLGGGMSLGGGINVGTLVGHVVADISKWTGGLTKAAAHLKGFSGKMDAFLKRNAVSMRRLGMRAAVMGGAIVAGVGGMIKTYGEFERRMRRATAVSEVTDKQFQQMSKMAEDASVRLNIAATQAVDAFYYLGSAGLTATEQMEAFPAIATLSKAAVIGMDHAAEMMVDTIKAYQKSFKDTKEVTDIFTAAVISSNMTFSHLGEAMSLVGSIARRTNNDIASITAAIGLMANVGIKGSRAGTSLRRALLNIAAPSSEIREELKAWGVEVYDATGKMKPFIQLIGEIGIALRGATEEQKNLAFKTMFGVRAITGQLAIFDLGVERVQAYIDQLKNAGDAAETVAKKQMRAFLEQMGRLGQEAKRLARHLGMSLAPAIRNIVDAIKPLVDSITKWVDGHKTMTTAILATVTAMGVVTLAGGALIMTLAGLTIAAGGLGVTVGGLALAIGATTLGIGALVGATVYLVARIIKVKAEIRRLKSELEMGDEIRQLTNFINKLDTLVKEPGPLNELIGRLIATRDALADIQEKARKAITATREELEQMLREMDMDVPTGLFGIPKATSVIREYILQSLEYSKSMILEMAEKEKDAVDSIMKDMTTKTEEGIEEQLSVYEMAVRERKRLRREEYDAWIEDTKALSKEWSEAEYRRVQATKDALDDMESSMASFFEDTIMDAKSWKDAFISFLKDIQRSMIRVFTTALAEQIMLRPFIGGILGGLFGGIKGGGAAPGRISAPPVIAAGAGGVLPGAFQPLQAGGIVKRPTLGLIGERGGEAVVPLSGGRSIPVDMKGAMPNIEINVINKTSKPVDAQRGAAHFDGTRFVTEVILKDVIGYGPIRKAITGLKG